MLGLATCEAAARLDDDAIRVSWELDPAAIACPVRIVWGDGGPAAVVASGRGAPSLGLALARRRVELDGVGHCPQLDVPLDAAQLILDF